MPTEQMKIMNRHSAKVGLFSIPLLLTLAFLASTAHANVAYINDTAHIDDSWLDFNDPNTANGAGAFMRFRDSNAQRGIIRVDLSDLDIESVQNATLIMRLIQAGNNNVAGFNVTDQDENVGWDETTITFNNEPCGGADELNIACSQVSVDGNKDLDDVDTYIPFNVTDVVISILGGDDSARKFTIQFNKTDNAGGDSVFATSEATTPEFRPALYLQYTPTASPPIITGGITGTTSVVAQIILILMGLGVLGISVATFKSGTKVTIEGILLTVVIIIVGVSMIAVGLTFV